MQSLRRGQIILQKCDAAGKRRPVLIVSPAFLNGGTYVTAVPFTSQQLDKRAKLKTCVMFYAGEFGLDEDCVAKTDDVTQYRLLDLRLSDGRIGEVDEAKMNLVSAALSFSLGITN